MKKFCLDLRKHATETINYEKNKMFPLTHEQIESFKNKTFCHICRDKLYDDDDSDVDSNDKEFDVRTFFGNASGLDDTDDDDDDDDDDYDHSDDSDDEEFRVKKFHSDTAGLDDVDGDQYDHDDNDDEELDVRKFHGDSAGLDDVDNYGDEEFDGMRYAGVNEN